MLSVYTVRKMDIVTTIIVNSKYLPSSGMTRDVGGLMSERMRKNTVSARSMEIESVIFSPDSLGR